ncbi:XkdX family protein [Caldalkalibacillus horti]|uniref:XkdX family protein n=1 Tax=Caldalkalibacillus horti TaxID=77523 RepID=A0ABT9W0S3_9BACI|nr:XkdX family protein [Bacillus horti]MDQ0166652.1 hypothetical protein [Bacillus horti]
MFNSIKRHYDSGRYSNDPSSDRWVGVFVQAGWITKVEYFTITQDEYPEI